MFGEQISQLKYYWLEKLKFKDINLIISRTGWSGELGYEIYLSEFDKGTYLFNQILEAGKEFQYLLGLNQARRIELVFFLGVSTCLKMKTHFKLDLED